MRTLFDLRAATTQALEYVSSQPDVEAVEVFASADANLTVRLNYTSHIPSNGVEEPNPRRLLASASVSCSTLVSTASAALGLAARPVTCPYREPEAHWTRPGQAPWPTRSSFPCPNPATSSPRHPHRPGPETPMDTIQRS